MEYKVTYLGLGEALLAIENHVLTIPNIQRPFVWTKNQIEDLISSVIEGYPLNLMTFLDIPKESDETNILKHSFEFITKYLKADKDWKHLGNYRSLRESKSENCQQLVFDGQQRLTSLNIAFCGSYCEYEGGSGQPKENSSYYKPKFLCVTKLDDDEFDYHWSELSNIETAEIEYRGNWYLNLRFIYKSIVNKQNVELVENRNRVIYESLVKTIRFSHSQKNTDFDQQITYLMILNITNANIAQGFQAFLRINNSGTQVSQTDLMLASIGCYWLEAKEKTEFLERNLKPKNEKEYYFTEPNDGAYRSLIIQGALIVGTNCNKIEPEVKLFNEDVSENIKNNWVDIDKAFLNSKEGINSIYLANTNRGMRVVLFYLYYKNPKLEIKQFENIIYRIHIYWFNNQSTENAKIKRMIDVINNDEYSIDVILIRMMQTLLIDRPFKSIEDLLNLNKEERATRKVLQLIHAKEDNYKPGQSYDVDHIHPWSKLNQKLSDESLDQALKLEISTYRNTLPNLHFLNSSINKGNKNDKDLLEWINENRQAGEDLKPNLFPFDCSDEDLNTENMPTFWNKRKAYLKSILEEILGKDNEIIEKLESIS